jgi:CHAT domain-containing protein
VKKRDSSHCPHPEVLAAFVAGNLSGEELEMTVEHMRECEDCRRVIAVAARFDRGNHELVAFVLPPRRRPWWVFAAAVAALGFLSIWMLSSYFRAPIRTLIAAAPRDARYLEPRVSGGFPWAPLRSAQRGEDHTPDPAHMKLIGVAGGVLEQNGGKRSIDAQHVSAIASLLAGDAGDAVTRLSKVTAVSSDPRLWSDLAAARFEEAVRSDDPRQLAQALAAVDAALRLDSRFPEALFNRGLILERLGLREEARAAWKAYLAVDGGSRWASEAEQHLRSLKVSVEFGQELQRHYRDLAANESAAAMLVHRFPQEARVWGESEILSRWGREEIAGRAAAAGEHLRVARRFGDELAHRGEHLLQQAVSSIDRADGAGRKTLAAAHVQLRDAQRALKAGRLSDAERGFRTAATGFLAAGSPMSLLARNLAANSVYAQGRIDESRLQLEQLARESRPDFQACNAQLQWQLGLEYASVGHWGRAMRSLDQSIGLFERLGERNYAMVVREILAEVYDRIGEPREAWRHRLVALQELGHSDDLRLRVAIHSIARGAALNHDWAVSLAFLNLQTKMQRREGDDPSYVNALLARARIEGFVGNAEAAKDDLTRAGMALTRLRDAGLRDSAEAERLAVEGSLTPSPARSIPLLTDAIGFQRSRGRRMFLPELLLQRGRAYSRIGVMAQAASDFDAGIRELEAQRMSIDVMNDRWGMFAVADELFDEAVTVALQRHDDKTAFAYSERARARELLDAGGGGGRPASQPLPDDTVLLEYLVLPKKMVIFIVDTSGIRAVQVDVASEVIADEVDLLIRTAASGSRAEFEQVATKVYDRLLGPVSDELAPGRAVIFVPDGSLSGVPFAALVDPAGRYLIEKRTIIVTPSLAAFLRTLAGKRQLGRRSHLLIVSGPSSRGEATRLTAAEREADAVAAAYELPAEITALADDPTSLERKVVTADVIHFVGHAIIPDGSNAAALVTSRRDGLEAQLDARDIAGLRLRRTSVVVLAACGTARSYGRAGEASISIARAFLAAGTSSVAATLWPIDDQPAAEFFPRLHYFLARGWPPAEALRAAQLEWIHRRDAPPGVWAAVQIIGS